MIINKNNIFFLSLLFLLTFTGFSCGNDERGIEMPYIVRFAIPAGSNTVETHYYEFNLPTNATLFLGDKKTAVKNIRATSARLRNIENIDYEFIQEISVSVDERIYEVCYRDWQSNNIGTYMDLIPNETNVKQFMVADHFKLIVRLRYRTPPPTTVEDNVLELKLDAFL